MWCAAGGFKGALQAAAPLVFQRAKPNGFITVFEDVERPLTFQGEKPYVFVTVWKYAARPLITLEGAKPCILINKSGLAGTRVGNMRWNSNGEAKICKSTGLRICPGRAENLAPAVVLSTHCVRTVTDALPGPWPPERKMFEKRETTSRPRRWNCYACCTTSTISTLKT